MPLRPGWHEGGQMRKTKTREGVDNGNRRSGPYGVSGEGAESGLYVDQAPPLSHSRTRG
jgi:hypothetical protein